MQWSVFYAEQEKEMKKRITCNVLILRKDDEAIDVKFRFVTSRGMKQTQTKFLHE